MNATGNGATRKCILKAALKTVSRLGYADASVGAIAREAGVNNVTVYRLFEGKENLFREVIALYGDVRFDENAFDRATRGRLSDARLLAAMAGAYFETIFRAIDIIRIFIVEAPHFDFVRRAAWYAPPPLSRHCARRFGGLKAAAGVADDVAGRHADMFLSHIVRRALEYNKHDSIWEYDGALAADFVGGMRPQIALGLALLKRSGGGS